MARRSLLTALLGLPLLPGRAAWAAADDIRFFRIGTAATTGTYFQIGGMLANAISKPPGSRDCDRGGSCGVAGLVAVAQATQGSVENVQAVGSNRLESALAQSDVALGAYAGTGLFKGKPPIKSLRTIAALFPESVHVVVRADGPIADIKDLKGKRVGLGEKESGTLVDARLILESAGIAEKDVKGDYRSLSLAAAALGHEELDAFFLFGGYPVPAISELATTTPTRLVAIGGELSDRLTRKYSFFSADTIPAGTYAGINQPTPTIGTRALWLVSADVPDDLVYKITQALWHEGNRHILDQGHPMGQKIRLDTALQGVVVPLHPGAERFYREAGMQIPEELNKSN
ncbi:MAG: TAXI family TRAP transporter solute-binding subunit [Stellaceae bacterium]